VYVTAQGFRTKGRPCAPDVGLDPRIGLSPHVCSILYYTSTSGKGEAGLTADHTYRLSSSFALRLRRIRTGVAVGNTSLLILGARAKGALTILSGRDFLIDGHLMGHASLPSKRAGAYDSRQPGQRGRKSRLVGSLRQLDAEGEVEDGYGTRRRQEPPPGWGM
jgi:hypothetical protein